MTLVIWSFIFECFDDENLLLKFEREEAEGGVTETWSFRHADPFNADEQDSLLTPTIKRG